jgi:putative transcriptional regulator
MILCYNEEKHFAGGNTMVISYKKLWKLLIDRDMKKKDLIAKSGISQSSVTKLGHNESVSTDIIVKICTALECDLTDIMELVPEEK